MFLPIKAFSRRTKEEKILLVTAELLNILNSCSAVQLASLCSIQLVNIREVSTEISSHWGENTVFTSIARKSYLKTFANLLASLTNTLFVEHYLNNQNFSCTIWL